MWRFFNSLTRGARTFRPSPCCSQESSDDSCCNFYSSDGQSSSLSCLVVPTRCYSAASSKERKNNVAVRLCRISCCLCTRIVRGSCSDVKAKHDHGKIVWVWAIPCDVYPHAVLRCGHQKGRQNYHFNWSHFYQEQQGILNALGWGSVTALAWTLSQDWRNFVYLSYPQNKNTVNDSLDIPVHIYNSDSARKSGEDRSRYSENKANLSGDCFSLLHQYPFIRPNANQNACFQPNLFNPEVNKSFFASLLTSAAEVELNKHEKPGTYLASDVDAIDCCLDTRPQLDTDRQILEREKRSEDSGYSEKVQEKSTSHESSHNECSICSQENDSLTRETPVGELEKYEVCPNVDKGSQHIFLGLPQQCANELPSESCAQNETSTNISVKENVLIEDCSSYECLQSSSKSSSEDTVSESFISSRKQRSAAAGIDEFSDGLKEILEAGRKDLNEFNTQFMGVLEGDIGRSISKEEPNLAVAYFRAGSLLGDPSSAYNLALCYHLGRGVEQDFKMARELYEAATLAGHGWATYNLAVLLLEGQGGPTDLKRARDLLTRAEKLGVREAEVALEEMKELQKEHHPQDMDVSGARHEDKRHSVRSYHSEPTLSSVLSGVWSSSYSTTDLDFLEDSCDHQVLDFSSMKTESTSKPRFYLE